MRPLTFLLLWLLPASSLLAQKFQLAQPVLLSEEVFFEETTAVRLRFDMAGATIRYTLDGTEPTEKSPSCDGNLTLRQSARLRARVFHPDFSPSETVGQDFFKIVAGLRPKSAFMAAPPSEKYPGGGVEGLLDFRAGGADASSKNWLGFEGTDLFFQFSYWRAKRLNSLTVSALSHTAAWIFPPRRATVWAKNRRGDWQKIAEQSLPEVAENAAPGQANLTLELGGFRARHWRVVVENHGPLPAWHPGNGHPAWLFVDEVLPQ